MLTLCLDSSLVLVLGSQGRRRRGGSRWDLQTSMYFLKERNYTVILLATCLHICSFWINKYFSWWFPPFMAELHRRQLSLAQFFSDKCSLYHLPSRFLFYYRRESVRNYYERHSVSIFKNLSQKNNYFLEIVTGLKLQLCVCFMLGCSCVLCWSVLVFNKVVFFAGTPFARRK